MILKDLRIQRELYGDKKDQYKGYATFDGEAGSVTLTLNKDHLDEIFKTCADSIIETSRAAARHLTLSLVNTQKRLEETK